MKQKGFTPILIAVLVLIGVVLYLGYKRINPTPPGAPINTNTPEPVSKQVDNNKVYTDPLSTVNTGYKHYENKTAGFEIEYPQNLIRQQFTFNDDGGGKIDLFCVSQQDLNSSDLSQGTPRCKDGGFNIWYTQTPGWGGGCDLESHKSTTFLGSSYDFCSYDTGFNQIYAKNNTTGFEFDISGQYGDKISKTETLKSLSTFKLIE